MGEHQRRVQDHRVSDADFVKGVYALTAAALVLPPMLGMAVLSFLGFYEFGALADLFLGVGAFVFIFNTVLYFFLAHKLLRSVLNLVNGTGDPADNQQVLTWLKRFPWLFFLLGASHFIEGVSSAHLALPHLESVEHIVYTFVAMVPCLLITTFPVYFYFIDYLGRYLAPRGIVINIAPTGLKIAILGLFTPVMIDTVLLFYYYDRTGYLEAETFFLWFVLLGLAAYGTWIAYASFQQGLAPIDRFIRAAETERQTRATPPTPQSLDEFGTLTARLSRLVRDNRSMEGSLAFEKELNNSIINNASALVLVLDNEGRITRFNDACEKLSGYAFAEVRGGYPWDYLLDPKEAETVRENAFDSLAKDPQKLTGRYTNYWVAKGGARYMIDWSNSVLLDDAGNMDYMISVGIDVTEKHKAEQALIESYQQQRSLLQLSQSLETARSFEDIVARLADEIRTTLGYRGCWLYQAVDENARYCDMIAHEGEVMSGAISQPDIVRLDMDSDPYLQHLRDAREVVVIEDMRKDPRTDKQKVEASGLVTSIHIPLVVKNRWYGMIGMGSFGEDGVHLPTPSELNYLQSLGVHVSLIFERIRISDELAKSNELLEQRVQERTRELKDAQTELLRRERLSTLGQLTATVSHELRNPLGAMRPSTYILRKQLTQDKAALKALERIERGIDRCDHIIDELLDFTRITNMELSRQSIDAWVKDVVEEQKLPGGLKVELRGGLDGQEVDFDPHRLRRALINIIENAAQSFTSDGTQQVSDQASISLQTRLRDNRIEIELSDNGPGIPGDVLPHIFEPLFSTKNFGVGLGMPTVKQIMEQHGGGIDVQSSPGEGTTVTLWLPAQGEADDMHS